MARIDWQEALETLADAFAATDSTPGGGAAAGTAGAVGCALGQMAAGISAKSKKADEERRAALRTAGADFARLRSDFLQLASDDALAFDKVMSAYKLPKTDPERAESVQTALVAAAEVPLRTAQKAVDAMDKIRLNKELTVGTVSSDMDCAVHLLRSAGLCALENVDINLSLIKDAASKERLSKEAAEVRGNLA